MYTNATSENRVVTNALSVQYVVERRKDGEIYWYKVTRMARKTYQYVDLTPSAASNVMAAKVLKYTRDGRKCISRTLDKWFESLTSEISSQRNDNGSYNVVVQVNENDSTHSATIPANPASLFTSENSRDYDEGEGGIEISDCNYDDGTLYILFYVTGDLVGTQIDAVQLHSGGERITSGVRVRQVETDGYLIEASNWDETKNTGKVVIGKSETDWSF